MIRPVTQTDKPALLDLAHRMHAASRYADRVPVDSNYATGLFDRLLAAQARHGEPGAAFLRLSHHAGQATGFVVGTLDRVYHLGPADRLRATDLFLFHDGSGDRRDGVRLLDAYLGWAEAQPNVIEVWAGVTDGIADHRRVGRLYHRRGFEPFGAIYRKDLK